MPDPPLTPAKHTLKRLSEDFGTNPPTPFVELGVTSCFSFLRGASDACDLVEAAFCQKHHALGIADRNTMAGVVRLYSEAKTAKLRSVIGCRVVLVEGHEFLAYPRDRAAYGRLCTLLSQGKMRTVDGQWQDKGECHLTVDMLVEHSENVQLIALPDEDIDAFTETLPILAARLPTMQHVAVSYLYRGDDRARIARLDALAKGQGLSILATNDVHYHAPERRPLQDVMTCIREKTTIADAGYLLHANAERHLKSPEEMQRLFADWPHAIAATREVADRCTFSLKELQYEYPEETVPGDQTSQDYLEQVAWEGAAWRYPDGIPDKVRSLVERELVLIGRLDIALNNAGIGGGLARLPDIPLDTYDQIMEINAKGVFIGMRHQLPVMLKQGGGSILNTASAAGLVGSGQLSAYAASKHAVIGMTKAAADEVARKGIRVNAICPSFASTPMVEAMGDAMGERHGVSRDDAYNMIASRVPMRRVADTMEVVQAMLWIVSDANTFMTGTTLFVDGGHSLVG